MEDSQKHLDDGGQILKTRDDRVPLYLACDVQSEETTTEFRLLNAKQCSWSNTADPISPEKLSHRIKPWLTALSQCEHLSLLIGSGLTHATQTIATEKSLPIMDTIKFDVFNEKITEEAKRVAECVGRTSGNFEDQLRIAQELLRGLEIIAIDTGKDNPTYKSMELLRENLKSAMNSFTSSILQGERLLVRAPTERREKAFSYLVNFLLSFASRPITLERLHLFTTNYDRFLEVGADVAGLRLIDRFVGSLSPIFRASRLNVDLHYNPPGIRGEPRYLEGVARFTKLHGSVDWVDCG